MEHLTPDYVRSVATRVRRRCGSGRLPVEQHAYFDIVFFLDVVLATHISDFRLEVKEDSEIPEYQAYTEQGGSHLIVVAESVMKSARRGDGDARYTLAHELGHFFLHQNLRLARYQTGDLPEDRSSEGQADLFALELLAPIDWVEASDTPETIEDRFQLDARNATIRYNQLKQEGVIKIAWRAKPQQLGMELKVIE